MAIANRTLFVALMLIFCTCTLLASWYQDFFFLLIPFSLLFIFWLLKRPEYLFYTLIVSIPWSVEYNLTPELGTDLPDEPLMWLTAFVVMIFIASRHMHRGLQKWHPLLYIVLLQFLWLVITVITSSDFILSFKFLLAKSWYLLAFIGAPLFLFNDQRILKRSALLLLCSMMVFMLVTIFRHALKGMSFEEVNDALLPFYRNHVNYSAILVFMIPVQVAVIRLTKSDSLKYFMTCMLIITIGALYFSYARGAWLAMLTGLIAFWLVRKGLLLFTFFLFVFICLASVFYISKNDRYLKFSNDKNTIFHTNFREHLIATYRLKDMSNGERIYRWVAGIRMSGDNWMTGFGPSTFYYHYKEYTVPSFRTYVSRNEERSTVHNYFLLVLIEQGVLGLLFFIALLATAFACIQRIYLRTIDPFWKITMASVASILVMECTVNFLSDMIETDKVGSVFLMCIAVVIVGDRDVKRET
jgi:O-antigen ligase